MTPPTDAVARLTALPCGTTRGKAHGKSFVASVSHFNAGQSIKLVAEELGGTDYISLNLYLLETGPRLYPCEMPAEKVIAFLRAFESDSAT